MSKAKPAGAVVAPRQVETLNRYGVTVHGQRVVSLMLTDKPGCARVFTVEEALNLAAWLVVGADMAGCAEGGALVCVAELVQAIEKT